MKLKKILLLSTTFLLSLGAVGLGGHTLVTRLNAVEEPQTNAYVAELNKVESFMKPGFKYGYDENTSTDYKTFKLLAAVSYDLKSIADVYNPDEYGIVISTDGLEPVRFDFEQSEEKWAKGQGVEDKEKFYVVIELGDLTTKRVRGDTEFTVKSYLKIGDNIYESTDDSKSVSKHSFYDLIDDTNYENVEAIQNLKNDYDYFHNNVKQEVVNSFGLNLFDNYCDVHQEHSYYIESERGNKLVEGMITSFTDADILKTNDDVILEISGTYVGKFDTETRIFDNYLKYNDFYNGVFDKEELYSGYLESTTHDESKFTLKYSLNGINYSSGLWRQYTLKPTISFFGENIDVKLEKAVSNSYAINKDKNASYMIKTEENNYLTISWCNNDNNDFSDKQKGINFCTDFGQEFYVNDFEHKVYYAIFGKTNSEVEADSMIRNSNRYKLFRAYSGSELEFSCVDAVKEEVSTNGNTYYKVHLTFNVHDFRNDEDSVKNGMMLGLKYDGLPYAIRNVQCNGNFNTLSSPDGVLLPGTITENTNFGHDWLFYDFTANEGRVILKGRKP